MSCRSGFHCQALPPDAPCSPPIEAIVPVRCIQLLLTPSLEAKKRAAQRMRIMALRFLSGCWAGGGTLECESKGRAQPLLSPECLCQRCDCCFVSLIFFFISLSLLALRESRMFLLLWTTKFACPKQEKPGSGQRHRPLKSVSLKLAKGESSLLPRFTVDHSSKCHGVEECLEQKSSARVFRGVPLKGLSKRHQQTRVLGPALRSHGIHAFQFRRPPPPFSERDLSDLSDIFRPSLSHVLLRRFRKIAGAAGATSGDLFLDARQCARQARWHNAARSLLASACRLPRHNGGAFP